MTLPTTAVSQPALVRDLLFRKLQEQYAWEKDQLAIRHINVKGTRLLYYEAEVYSPKQLGYVSAVTTGSPVPYDLPFSKNSLRILSEELIEALARDDRQRRGKVFREDQELLSHEEAEALYQRECAFPRFYTLNQGWASYLVNGLVLTFQRNRGFRPDKSSSILVDARHGQLSLSLHDVRFYSWLTDMCTAAVQEGYVELQKEKKRNPKKQRLHSFQFQKPHND
jgi:hypothetical protein